MNKKLLAGILLIISAGHVRAQDDLEKELEGMKPKNEKQLVIATFKGQRLINMSTLECVGKRALDFRIAHRFQNVNQGINGFYGLDGPASLRLSFDYSFDGRFQFGIARNNLDKLYESSLKYRLLRQTEDNKMPVSVTLLSQANAIGLKEDKSKPNRFQHFSSRLGFMHQVIIGRKFNKALSLQLAPIFIHLNMVIKASDKNDIYALAFAGRYKLTKRMAITGEYIARLNKYSETSYVNSASIGIDIETGGHVFQMFFTNSFALNETQNIPFTTDKWSNGGFRLGFNISRSFTL